MSNSGIQIAELRKTQRAVWDQRVRKKKKPWRIVCIQIINKCKGR